MLFSVSGIHFVVAFMTSVLGTGLELILRISERKNSMFSGILLSSHAEWYEIASCGFLIKITKKFAQLFIKFDKKFAKELKTTHSQNEENEEVKQLIVNLRETRDEIEKIDKIDKIDKILSNSIYFDMQYLKYVLASSILALFLILLFASFTETVFPSQKGPTFHARGVIVDKHHQGTTLTDNVAIHKPVSHNLLELALAGRTQYDRIIKAVEEASFQTQSSVNRPRFVVMSESTCEVFVPSNLEKVGTIIPEDKWTPEMKESFYGKKLMFNEMSRISDTYGVYVLFTYHEYHINVNTNVSEIAYNKLTVFSPFQPNDQRKQFFFSIPFLKLSNIYVYFFKVPSPATGKRDSDYLNRMRRSKHLKDFAFDTALQRMNKFNPNQFEIRNQENELNLEFKLTKTENGGGGIEIDYIKANLVFGSEAPFRYTAGKQILPFLDTIFGRIGFIICMDGTHPRYLKQAGLSNVDILMSPSWDWQGLFLLILFYFFISD